MDASASQATSGEKKKKAEPNHLQSIVTSTTGNTIIDTRNSLIS
jgi:hypothetical protein